MTNKARGEVRIKYGDLEFDACLLTRAVARVEGRLDGHFVEIMTGQLLDGKATACLVFLEECCLDDAARAEIGDQPINYKALAKSVELILKASGLLKEREEGDEETAKN